MRHVSCQAGMETKNTPGFGLVQRANSLGLRKQRATKELWKWWRDGVGEMLRERGGKRFYRKDVYICRKAELQRFTDS